MNSEFELPIFYLENKKKLDSNIINDLELLAVNEETEEYDSDSNNDNNSDSDASKEKGIDQENQDKTNRKC